MKVKFITFGCKVNQYETQALREKFIFQGAEITEGIADLYVINTCSVTSRADSKSRQAVLKAKRENPLARIAVCGCLVQLNRDFISKIKVDYIIPQNSKQAVSDIILGKPAGADNIWALKISEFFNQRAFVKIQDGCDNFCSFCKIPYIRGCSVSRDKRDIIDEIRRVSLRHKEIVLCGINLGLYGRDLNYPLTLGELVAEILEINSLARLRLSSLEPSLVDDKLLVYFSHNKLCPHVHFPFQSGDDRILKDMNKKERVSLYEDIVDKLRKVNPAIAISCDIMVGFPSEDELSFSNTVNFLKRVKPMRTHIFTFSPRENTSFSGIKLRNQKSIRQRHKLLKHLADGFSLEYKKKFRGITLHMVAEERNNQYVCGYTENYIQVYVKKDITLGEIVPVQIERIEKHKVSAKVL